MQFNLCDRSNIYNQIINPSLGSDCSGSWMVSPQPVRNGTRSVGNDVIFEGTWVSQKGERPTHWIGI